jgi:hypothetical protein
MKSSAENNASQTQTGGVGQKPRRGVVGDPTPSYPMQVFSGFTTGKRGLLSGFRYWDDPLRKRRKMVVRIAGEVVGENVGPVTPVQRMVLGFLALRADLALSRAAQEVLR